MTQEIVIISTDAEKNCAHFHHFVVVIKSTDLNMMAPCFYHEPAVKLTTQKTAGSMDMSVSGLVAKSVTGMVTSVQRVRRTIYYGRGHFGFGRE